MTYVVCDEATHALRKMLAPLGDANLVWERHWKDGATFYRAYRELVKSAGLRSAPRQSVF